MYAPRALRSASFLQPDGFTLSELAARPRINQFPRRNLSKRAYSYFLKTYYHRNRETLWAACRAVVVGGIIIALGLLMTILGYFDRDLTTRRDFCPVRRFPRSLSSAPSFHLQCTVQTPRIHFNGLPDGLQPIFNCFQSTLYNMTTGDEIVVIDASLRYKLKSMQYVGPVLMGLGTFLLIIACVITLESRDRHAQIIQEESSGYKTKREMINSATKFSLLPNEEADDMMKANHLDQNDRLLPQRTDRPSINSELELVKENHLKNQQNVKAEVHHVIGEEEEAGPSNRKSQSLRESLKRNGGQRFSLQKPPLPESGLLLSTIHLKKPKGPAPIAQFDSQLEIPLSSASCSTLGTSNYRS
uniref:Col_cuticle_N domain-containing protein n=1 Tax=Bursaphelenchus xylophilus TaxID=6326 RepID=A0A1I7S925_BURXY